MQAPQHDRSPLLRFFDAFLQEQNIKWILATGMLIVLGSSLMMVTSHWDQINNVWKYLIILGYTALIHAGGQGSYRHLGLRKTGTLLMALTVLLLPVTFSAWHWLWSSGGSSPLVCVLLLAVNLGLCWAASRRVFDHLLGGPQPTFLACYLALSLAGAFAPVVAGWGDAAAWSASLALWGVVVVGAVKVNRHVFWLTETRRAPKIFGFFPIVLLAGQFLALFAAHFALHVPTAWLGFALVLAAVPILLTADAVARVFYERTGKLVRALPLSIALPLALGVIVCAAGVSIAATGLVSTGGSYALVPTAALAAVLMGLVAHRTGKQAFVWAMLAGIVVAYQFSPVFFLELARQAVSASASAVHESRLPLAFYGLTYLPLLTVLMGAAVVARRRGSELFYQPLRAFCVGVSLVLLLAAFGHPKAIFPVATCLTLLFTAQTIVFRQRILALPTILGWFALAAGVAPFAQGVLAVTMPAGSIVLSLSLAAAVLTVLGKRLDCRLARLSDDSPSRRFLARVNDSESRATLCETAGLAASIGISAAWLLLSPWLAEHTAACVAAVILAGLLCVESLRRLHVAVSGAAYGFAVLAAVAVLLANGFSLATVASLVTLLLVGQWLLTYAWERQPDRRLAVAFGRVNQIASFYGLALCLAVFCLPLMVMEMVSFWLPISVQGLWWPCYLLVTVWAFDAARRTCHLSLAALGSASVVVFIGTAFLLLAGPAEAAWLPTVWSITALAALPMVEWLKSRQQKADSRQWKALAVPTNAAVLIVLAAVAVGSLALFTWPMRIAGGLALAGLVTVAVRRRQSTTRAAALALVNWQLLAAILQLTAPYGLESIVDLLGADVIAASLPLALASSLSLLVWQRLKFAEDSPAAEFALGQQGALRSLVAVTLLFSLSLPALGAFDIALALATFATLAVSEVIAACVKQSERRVWLAEGIATAAIGFFLFHGVFVFGTTVALFAPLGVGLAMWAIANLAKRRESTHILARPLHLTAVALPAATVGMGLVRHLTDSPTWLGANSLALLFAAGFYFWQAVESGRKGWLLASAAVLNMALGLLWRELDWSDPQFYLVPLGISILGLVELLREELPESLRNPLRYLGALVVLVSPVFHVLGGSWLHLFTLMVLSVAVILLSIGLRIRATMYTGVVFLVADLIAMVVRGSVHNPSVLWIAGVAFGAAIVVLGAICEHNREQVLQRMRMTATRLAEWS